MKQRTLQSQIKMLCGNNQAAFVLQRVSPVESEKLKNLAGDSLVYTIQYPYEYPTGDSSGNCLSCQE